MLAIGILTSILVVSSATPAAAYIDPVTGSVILQALVGGFAAALVAIRSFREKVVSFFRGKSSKGKDAPEASDE